MRKSLSKIVSSLVLAGTLLSVGAVAMAAETKTEAGTASTQSSQQVAGKATRGGSKGSGKLEKGVKKDNIENELKTLVSAGIITQDESDKILALSNQEAEARQAEKDKVKNMTEEERKAYLESTKGQIRDKKGDTYSQAVSSGIITQEKADSIKAKLQETRVADKKAKLSEGLAGLVTAGTITQEQADKITTYVSTLEANKQSSGAAATSDQKNEKKNLLSALVDDGTLTQAQLDEVNKVIPLGGGHGRGGNKGLGTKKAAKAAGDTTSSSTSN